MLPRKSGPSLAPSVVQPKAVTGAMAGAESSNRSNGLTKVFVGTGIQDSGALGYLVLGGLDDHWTTSPAGRCWRKKSSPRAPISIAADAKWCGIRPVAAALAAKLSCAYPSNAPSPQIC